MTQSNKIAERLDQWRDANPLKKLRMREGLTVENCATMLGCSLKSIQTWESGSQVPSLSNRKLMRDELGIRINAWTAWLDAKPKLRIKR